MEKAHFGKVALLSSNFCGNVFLTSLWEETQLLILRIKLLDLCSIEHIVHGLGYF